MRLLGPHLLGIGLPDGLSGSTAAMELNTALNAVVAESIDSTGIDTYVPPQEDRQGLFAVTDHVPLKPVVHVAHVHDGSEAVVTVNGQVVPTVAQTAEVVVIEDPEYDYKALNEAPLYGAYDYSSNPVEGTLDRPVFLGSDEEGAVRFLIEGEILRDIPARGGIVLAFSPDENSDRVRPFFADGRPVGLDTGEPLLIRSENEPDIVYRNGKLWMPSFGRARMDLLLAHSDGCIEAIRRRSMNEDDLRFQRNEETGTFTFSSGDGPMFDQTGYLEGFRTAGYLMDPIAQSESHSFFRLNDRVVAADADRGWRIEQDPKRWRRTGFVQDEDEIPRVITRGGEAAVIFEELSDGDLIVGRSVAGGLHPARAEGWRFFRGMNDGRVRMLSKRQVRARFRSIVQEGMASEFERLLEPAAEVWWEGTIASSATDGEDLHLLRLRNGTSKHRIAVHLSAGDAASTMMIAGVEVLFRTPTADEILAAFAVQPWRLLRRLALVTVAPDMEIDLKDMDDDFDAARWYEGRKMLELFPIFDGAPLGKVGEMQRLPRLIGHELGHAVDEGRALHRRLLAMAMTLDGVALDRYLLKHFPDAHHERALAERIADLVSIAREDHDGLIAAAPHTADFIAWLINRS